VTYSNGETITTYTQTVTPASGTQCSGHKHRSGMFHIYQQISSSNDLISISSSTRLHHHDHHYRAEVMSGSMSFYPLHPQQPCIVRSQRLHHLHGFPPLPHSPPPGSNQLCWRYFTTCTTSTTSARHTPQILTGTTFTHLAITPPTGTRTPLTSVRTTTNSSVTRTRQDLLALPLLQADVPRLGRSCPVVTSLKSWRM
jgi:hypothetical protein